eukprot:scaffold2636_cov340-Pavlova_lutheri.AAC.73
MAKSNPLFASRSSFDPSTDLSCSRVKRGRGGCELTNRAVAPRCGGPSTASLRGGKGEEGVQLVGCGGGASETCRVPLRVPF